MPESLQLQWVLVRQAVENRRLAKTQPDQPAAHRFTFREMEMNDHQVLCRGRINRATSCDARQGEHRRKTVAFPPRQRSGNSGKHEVETRRVWESP